MSPGSARTIALAQCFKPITYKIDQHRNEPWQVLALWPLLNTEANKSKLYYVLSICSSPRPDIPFYKNPKSTIRLRGIGTPNLRRKQAAAGPQGSGDR